MKWVIFLILLTTACVSCAQQKGIEKVYGFRQLRMPGNIAVDDNGNPLGGKPDSTEIIYIETSGEAPEWKAAYKNEKLYSVYTALLEPKPLNVGRDAKNGEQIIINIKPGNRLWELTLTRSSASADSAPRAAKNNDIILEGTYKGKPFTKRIQNRIELVSPEFM